jgi:hypothetical protein
MAEGLLGNLLGGGNKPSSINSRHHIQDVQPLTDTEKQKWTQYRTHFRPIQHDPEYDGIANGWWSLDDEFHGAIKHLTTVEKEFRESLESGEVKLTAKGERDYLALKKNWMNEGAGQWADWMYFHANLGVINQETGEVNTTIATSTREEPAVTPTKPVEEYETTGIIETVTTAIGNLLNGGMKEDTPPPKERTMSEDEKAQIEEHIHNTDIDFEQEMNKERVTLTNLGNNAWGEIRSAVRDGTLPLHNYNNDFLRGKLDKEGYFTQSEPEDPMRFGDQLVTPSKPPQEDFGGKIKPPAQPPMGGPIQFDKAGRPMDMPIEPPRGGIGEMMGGFMDMFLPPPMLPHEEEEQRLREIAEQEAALSPEDPEEAARKARAKDVEKTDRRFEEAHGKITNEGERIWEEVRMKYLDTGGFDYANELQKVIERHRIPEPVDCVVDVAPWSDEGWVDNCDTHGVWVRSRQRPAKMTPPQYGGKPCPDYSELPPSVEERPCDPVDAKWKWSDWRECGEDGPSGIQVRTTILGEEAKYGGKPYEYQKETRECTMPVVEEPLPPVATVPVISPVTHPAIIEAEKPNPIDILLGWINMGGGLQNTVVVPTVPVQVDGGTGQGTLLPEQTTPIAPAETTPVVTEEPAETTVVVEEEPDCGFSEGAWGSWGDCGSGEYPGNYQSRSKLISSTNKDPMCNEYVSDEASKIKQPLSDAAWDSQSSDNFGGISYTNDEGVYVHEIFHSRKCTPPAEEPVVEETVVVDSATTQDSSLPAQTSIPDTTSETPSPVIVDVNIIQQPASSGGGGGQTATTPAATTTETTEEEEETTTEEPEEGSNALKIVGGLAVLSGIGYWAYQKYA